MSCLLTIATSMLLQFKPLDIPLTETQQKNIYSICQEYEVDYPLTIAIIETESNFNEKIISKSNDYGLMQINKINHKWLKKELKIKNFLNYKDNVRAGVYILSLSKDENLEKMLMAYHFGKAGAKKLWKKGIYTSKYSRLVLERRKTWNYN